MSLLESTPPFTLNEACEFARESYGLDIQSAEFLPSERDQNLKILDAGGHSFVLKISSGSDSPSFLMAQNEMMRRVSARTSGGPMVLKSLDGSEISEIADSDQRRYCARMVTFLTGDVMANLAFRSPTLLHDTGRFIGQLSNALEGFEHPAFKRSLPWDLACAEDVVQSGIAFVRDDLRRKIIETITHRFKNETRSRLQRLPKSVIHNDANDGNLIVRPPQPSQAVHAAIEGLIDFGDAVFSWTLGELAIAIAYAILDNSDPLAAASSVVKGYHSVRELTDLDLEALFGLVCMRLCVSAVMAENQRRQRPNDPYLTISQEPLWRTLPKLARIPFRFAEAVFRDAVGRTPSQKGDRIAAWLGENQDRFSFPLKRLAKEKLGRIDLSVTSPALGGGADAHRESNIARVVQTQLDEQQAGILIGRYAEPRLLYSSPQFSSDAGWADESRTIHLGIDLFAEAGREVRAPYDGTVHRVRRLDRELDYGPLIILRHETTQGDEIYTLFGHLSAGTLNHLEEGDPVTSGQTIGWLGDTCENGGWTPHLHFQLISDLLELDEEFPGVGYASMQNAIQALSPNPNLMLGLDDSACTYSVLTLDESKARRKQSIGSNLSVGYQLSLKLTRGWMQHVWDHQARRYLDAYNNVPHVGHCHPRVVEAGARQMRLLNTNTRYLNDGMHQLAERLIATMPAPLSICYLLNSASEANELALRLARAHTGRKGLVVLEAAYHGNTTTLIDISPYKHDGPGGKGAASWVHAAPIPDCYRGAYRNLKTAGRQFAEDVGRVVMQLAAKEKGICGFIAETCPSVGGQIIPPDGFLSDVYRCVRAAGGVCIADEVQTGLGRLGKAFYGFELQNVVPDIVVLGKPMGNGHPLAAVVTRAEIADSFSNGMEFFSTFGGNTVSCAIGLAVLDVLQQESLQASADRVGEHLLRGLNEMQKDYPIIGDVRGMGLFLGVELVGNRETQAPAGPEAAFIANRMRERGVLIGTDGPHHNVLKIRPPMQFNFDDADELLDRLARCLAELPNADAVSR